MAEERKTVLTESRMNEIFELETQMSNLKNKLDSLKNEVEEEMRKTGMTRYQDSIYEIHYKSGNCTEKFDLTRFEKEDKVNYALYFDKYHKTSIGKDSFAWSKQKKFEEKTK